MPGRGKKLNSASCEKRCEWTSGISQEARAHVGDNGLTPYRLSCAALQSLEAQKVFRNTRARDSRVNGEGRRQLPELMLLEWGFNNI